MKKKHGCLFFLLGTLTVTGVFLFYLIETKESSYYRLVGSKELKELDNLYVNIYQTTEFDHNTALAYEIINVLDSSLVVKRHFLYGTTTHNEKISSFSAGVCDSVIYITYYPITKIYALHDLKSNTGYPHGMPSDSLSLFFENKRKLFERVKKCRKDLDIIM